ncbi:hypothetical protein QNN88_10220 [Citrobacter sp. ANG330]|uniref:hypothetical protein n=1 Tax=Citrobacter sp. ANG330 TaxID=3048142 RepID=UPI0039C109ED
MKIIGHLHRNTEVPPTTPTINLPQRVTLPVNSDPQRRQTAKNIAHARQYSFLEIIKLVTLFVSVIGSLSLIAARASSDQDLDAEEEAEDDIQNIDNIADLPPALLSSASQPETQMPVDDTSQADVQMTTFITPAHPALTALTSVEIPACSDARQNDSRSGYDTDKPFSFGQQKEVAWPTKDVKTTISCRNTLRFNPAISLNISEGIRPDKTGSWGQSVSLCQKRVQPVKTSQNTTITRNALTADDLKRPQQSERTMCADLHTENKIPQHETLNWQIAVQAKTRGAYAASLNARIPRNPGATSVPGNVQKYRALAAASTAYSSDPDTVPAAPGAITVSDIQDAKAVVKPSDKQNCPSLETEGEKTSRLITAPEDPQRSVFNLPRINIPLSPALRTDLQVSIPVISDPETQLVTQRKMVLPGYFRSFSPTALGLGQISGPVCIKLCVIFIILTVLFYR